MNKDKNIEDDLTRECLECGQEFIPDESGQECCCNDCAAAYYDWDDWDWLGDDNDELEDRRTGL